MFLSGAGYMNRSRVKIGPAPQHCVRGNNNFQLHWILRPLSLWIPTWLSLPSEDVDNIVHHS